MLVFLAGAVCFPCHAVKAEWQSALSLLGQNHVMACLLLKHGGGENTEVLEHQSHTSAVTLRMEKDLQEAPEKSCALVPLAVFQEERSHHLGGAVCV